MNRRTVRRAPYKVAKWLALCLPYGIFKMWHKDCRWNIVLKSIITAIFVGAIVTAVVYPYPTRTTATTVKLVGIKPEAEVLGPQAPSDYDVSKYLVTSASDTLCTASATDDVIHVYVSSTEGSTYYHTKKCKYAYASSRELTLREAHMLGYDTPCGLCDPPLYTGE